MSLRSIVEESNGGGGRSQYGNTIQTPLSKLSVFHVGPVKTKQSKRTQLIQDLQSNKSLHQITGSIPISFVNSPSNIKNSNEEELFINGDDDLILEENTEVEKCSYRLKGKNSISACFQVNGEIPIPDYPGMVKRIEFKADLTETIKRIIHAKIYRDALALESERSKLSLGGLVNLIIYDIQTTNVPYISENHSTVDGNTNTIEYPSIIQFSFYHPLTGRHLTSYIRPRMPISSEVSICTGIFNSFTLKFRLKNPERAGSDTETNTEIINEYLNMTLLDYSPVAANIDYFQDEINKQDTHGEDNHDEHILELAIEKFLAELDRHTSRAKSLEELDAPYLEEKLDDIIEFISIGECSLPEDFNYDYISDDILTDYSRDKNETNPTCIPRDTTTIFMAHNGSRWAEPIFRKEINRLTLHHGRDSTIQSRFDNIIYLDSKDLYRGIFENTVYTGKDNIESFNRMFGDNRPDSFDTTINVLSLWKSIERIMGTAYGRKDFEFICSKIMEELYLRKHGGR